jgi:hypothetical protein
MRLALTRAWWPVFLLLARGPVGRASSGATYQKDDAR